MDSRVNKEGKKHPRKFSIEILSSSHLSTEPTLTKIKFQSTCFHTKKKPSRVFPTTEGLPNGLRAEATWHV